MKKAFVVVMLSGLLMTGFAGSGCVVHTHAMIPGPHVSVRYHTVSGRRVLVVPRSVHVGHTVILSGNRCTVRQFRRGQVQVMYPNGRVVWIDCVRR